MTGASARQAGFEIVIITGSGSDRLLMYLTAELWLPKLRSAKPGARAVGPGNP
jgi:hypothetical protein